MSDNLLSEFGAAWRMSVHFYHEHYGLLTEEAAVCLTHFNSKFECVTDSNSVPCLGPLGCLQIHCIKELSIFQAQSAAGRQKLLNVVLTCRKGIIQFLCV